MDIEAGRELDARIAETVFGWQWEKHPTEDVRYFRMADKFVYGIIINSQGMHYLAALPAYSTDIAAAWLVVESPRLAELFANVEVSIIRFLNYYACQIEDDTGANCVTAHAPTAPLAICRAALEALTP